MTNNSPKDQDTASTVAKAASTLSALLMLGFWGLLFFFFYATCKGWV